MADKIQKSSSRRGGKPAAETPFMLDVGTPVEVPNDPLDGLDDIVSYDESDETATLDDPYTMVREANDRKHAAGRGFYENLVDRLDKATLMKLQSRFEEDARLAEDSNKPWLDQLAEGIRRCGVTADRSAGSQPFPGASTAVYPMITMAAIDLKARTTKELLPAGGPVKTTVVGEPSPEKSEKADRVGRFMNWQCTNQIDEYRTETEKLLMMLAWEGSSFKKIWYDAVLGRPRVAYVPQDRMIIPYAAMSLETCPFFEERVPMHPADVQDMIDSGEWADHRITTDMVQEESPLQQQLDKTEGRTDPQVESTTGEVWYRQTHVRCWIPELEDSPESNDVAMLEATSADPEGPIADAISGATDLIGEGQALPSRGVVDPTREPAGSEWLVVRAEADGTIVSIVRNWRQSDPLKRRRRCFSHYQLFPWYGFRGLSYLHFLGRLQDSSTGALRALLDSAQISNMPGGVYLDGVRAESGTIQFRPFEWLPLSAPFAKDIRSIMMPFPSNGPSNVLFQLLDFVAKTGKDFVSVATQQIADANANMPVGTTLALLEEGSRVYSDIHARLHAEQGRELRLLHEINGDTLDDNVLAAVFGTPGVSAADFDGEVDVVPVSDPDVFSQVQRSAAASAALELITRANADGVKVNKRLGYTNVAKALHLQDVALLFPEEPQPIASDSLSEHVIAAKGGEIMVSEEQDHAAHIEAHVALLTLPGMASSPVGLKLFTHIQEHMATWARQPFVAVWRVVLKRQRAEDPLSMAGEQQEPPLPMELENAASRAGVKLMQQVIEPLRSVFQPQDAASQMAQAEKAKADAKVMEIQARTDSERQKLEFDRERISAEMMASIEETRVRTESERELMTMQGQIDQRNISAKLEAELARIRERVQMQREQRASNERIAAAQIEGV